MSSERDNYKIADAVVVEMRQEAETTKRLFDVIPDDKLDWRPHPKSRTLGELAFHIATVPFGVAQLGDGEVMERPDMNETPTVRSREELLALFEDCLEKGIAIVNATDDDKARANWTGKVNGVPVMTLPRMAFWRAILLNHLYHHRGQLSVYLRELDIPLPSIYGPSADEDPFA